MKLMKDPVRNWHLHFLWGIRSPRSIREQTLHKVQDHFECGALQFQFSSDHFKLTPYFSLNSSGFMQLSRTILTFFFFGKHSRHLHLSSPFWRPRTWILAPSRTFCIRNWQWLKRWNPLSSREALKLGLTWASVSSLQSLRENPRTYKGWSFMQ